MKIINRDKGPWAFAQVINGGFAGYFRILSGERRREKRKELHYLLYSYIGGTRLSSMKI